MIVNNGNSLYLPNQLPLAQSVNVSNQPVQSYVPAPSVNTNIQPQNHKAYANILDNFSPELFARFRASAVTQSLPSQQVTWKNDLRQMFADNKAIIYAMIPRTFNAKDIDGSGIIDLEKGEQVGTFKNAIERLDELKGYGINTLHILPIHEPGKQIAKGTAGSLYAPKDMLEIDPLLADKSDPRPVKEQCKEFINECHKRGIRAMIDLPSCGSVDLYNKRPDLMAIDERGFPKVPQGWEDIRMLEPWADKDNRVLNKALLDYHKQFVDMSLELGFDGIRVDVARAKPVEFWDELIPYTRSKDPQFAFLAETYTYEDASPMLNMPQDRPEELLAAGFDSYYGQYHIFHSWPNAKSLHDYVKDNLKLSHKLPKGKSAIGSFATHDDNSPMSNGGVPYCNLTTGLQSTLPMMNPYYVTGFESGDRYIYDYKDKPAAKSMTSCKKYDVNPEWVDIFNLSRKPGGKNPEIGEFMGQMSKVRKQYEDVITKGSYIPLEVKGNKNDKIIAYARHYNGKTLLVVANKEVNSRQEGSVIIPGFKSSEPLKDLTMSYGFPSKYLADEGALKVDLGAARFHLFEIDTPSIEKDAKEVYRQNI